jgi:hypothetical protein
MAYLGLANTSTIGTALFVKLEVDYYKATAAATPTSQVLTFSDFYRNITFDSVTYTGLGSLLGVSSTTSELKSSNSSVTITISGIPNTSTEEIVNSRIKGSKITVYRAILDDYNLMAGISPNPVGRFFGFVNNYSLEEEYNIEDRTAKSSISLICSSVQELLDNKIAGRKTNPSSQKTFYSTDVSMDRVPNLVGANFNFGVPK